MIGARRPRAVAALLGLTLSLLSGLLTSPAAAEDPDLVYGIYFRSDWCPNCAILEPSLEDARARSQDLPLELLVIDLSAGEADFQLALGEVLDRGLARHYNQYFGLTGFVLYAAADTGEVLDCVTRLHDADAIVRVENHVVEAVRSRPPHDRAPGGAALCPPPMRAPPPPLP
ncbi:hypothetical protein [Maricaulis sp.]|uniref:hypothetical protein n=1 Tax=Maricaulis sp. TaxID=1486257 RepID=UPI003A94E1D2